jgi:hypothetical protein
MRLEDQLTSTITEHVATVAQPVPDLSRVITKGRGLRRRRQAATLAAVAAIAVGAALAGRGVSDLIAPNPERFAPVGPLDYSEGLRAFASPDADGEVSLGGRSFPIEDMGYLDTEATATPHGLVFFDGAGQAHLLAQDGTDQTLAPAPTDQGDDFRPSAKADARLPLVAFTQPDADGVTVRLVDLDTGSTLDTILVPCAGLFSTCENVRVEGVDRGLVFVRTGEGTFVWNPESRGEDRWTLLGDGDFRVADVRNGRVLWSDAPPAPAPDSPVADWSFTQGKIDAELSYDGRHILYWSSTLKPTEPGGRTLRLDVKDAIWFTFDTDGSVLAATSGSWSGQRSPVFDCKLPTGACERIGSISTRSGDPMFIGNDM